MYKDTAQLPEVNVLSDICSKILADNLPAIGAVLNDVETLRKHGWSQANELECRLHFDKIIMLLFYGKADGSADSLKEGDYTKPHIMVS